MWLWFLAAPSQTGGTPTPSAGAGFTQLLIWLVPMLLLMWLLIFRPQKRQQEVHRRMLSALKKGDRVVTSGGMVGEVTDIDEDEVRLRIADKVEARFVKSAISRVLGS